MDSYFVLLSVVLGVLLFNSAVLINSFAWHKNSIDHLPIEIRYVAILSIVLLVLLNGNQFIAGEIFFPIFAIALVLAANESRKKLSILDVRYLIEETSSLLFVQLFTIVLLYILFGFGKYWLLEAHNHDSLFYYYGAYWANESRMFVGSESVRAQWGFDTWIGFDKPLYRGGTYTLAAWIQYFSPRTTGNALYFIAVYSATIAWFAVKLLPRFTKGLCAAFVSIALALLVALSTGVTGALTNSNLATVMGGASLMLIFAIALRSDIKPAIRYGLMAIWSAIGAQFYGESVFYAGLLIFLIFLFELSVLYRMLKLIGLIRLVIQLIIIIIIIGNIPVIQSLSSLLLFSDIAKGGDWASWYMHQIPFYWIGSFIAGLLIGIDPSISVVVAASVITLLSVASLIWSQQFRVGVLGLIGVSLLSVIYVEMTSYQYGEHKILHLLGPSWMIAIAATITFLINNIDLSVRKIVNNLKRGVAVSIFIALFIITLSFLLNSIVILSHMRGPHSLDFGVNSLTSFVRPGDSILIDDNEWVGVEKFFKSHYLIFHLQHQKANVLMPNIASDILRGGYQRQFVGNTLKDADKVDWLIKGRGGVLLKDDEIIEEYGKPIWENKNYRLYNIKKKPVIVSGNGWHDCELRSCWTSGPFQVEAYVPPGDDFKLVFDFTAFAPPENGVITVRNAKNEIVKKIDGNANEVELELKNGWSIFVFEPDWKITSPKNLRISDDSRNLFLSISRMKIKSRN